MVIDDDDDARVCAGSRAGDGRGRCACGSRGVRASRGRSRARIAGSFA